MQAALSRRTWLQAASAGALATAAGFSPRVAFAQARTERRFIFILQRGAADGLNTVVPYADPGYARLRGALAIDPAAAHKLDGSFALHPSLAGVAKLHAAGQALFVHAVASPYRDRSHFDGQNVLETGGAAPYQVKDGWMNRLAGLLPRRPGTDAIAFTATVPMALRGTAEVTSYAPSSLPGAGDDLLARVQHLYAQDAQLAPLWTAAMQARGMGDGMADARNRLDPAALGKMAAGFLARTDGPRIALIESNGWDTHSAQNARLANQLRGLDALVGALQVGLGAAWDQTVVLVATEFGRTAAANGTGGTDHGTASAAMLLGGAVQGGKVIADWPGLAPAQLHEGRDLKPTLDLDRLIASAAAQTFGLDADKASRVLVGRNVQPLPVLVRA